MNKMKKETGITLLAIVITIVILLILVGITIYAVNDSKLFYHARRAAFIHDMKSYTNRNNVKLKNLSYEIPGTNLNNLVSEKYNAILNNNMWLASRYVYVLKNTSSDSYWISFNLSVYDYSSALNDNSSGYLFGNNTSGINKTHYLAPVCILNSSTPIDYVSTDNEVNTWKIE